MTLRILGRQYSSGAVVSSCGQRVAGAALLDLDQRGGHQRQRTRRVLSETQVRLGGRVGFGVEPVHAKRLSDRGRSA